LCQQFGVQSRLKGDGLIALPTAHRVEILRLGEMRCLAGESQLGRVHSAAWPS
jgi:hypothetical protein